MKAGARVNWVSERKKAPEVLEASLQTITLIEIAERLAELQDSMAEMKPRGIIPSFESEVTDQILELTGSEAWFSFDIYVEAESNDVFIMVNHMNRGSGRQVSAKGRYAMSAATAVFEHVYAVCNVGERARIRVEAVY